MKFRTFFISLIFLLSLPEPTAIVIAYWPWYMAGEIRKADYLEGYSHAMECALIAFLVFLLCRTLAWIWGWCRGRYTWKEAFKTPTHGAPILFH